MKKPKKPTKAGGRSSSKHAKSRAASRTTAPTAGQGTVVVTKKQLAAFIDKLVDDTNTRVRKTDVEKNAGADDLFRQLCRNDSSIALDLAHQATPEYRQMRARAGHSLRLAHEDLSTWVRIGALNHRLSTTAWPNLDWSVKEELLALVDVEDEGLEDLRKGVAHASGGGVTLEDVRNWKRVHYPQRAGTRGRPAEVTLTAGRRLADTGTRLGSVRERRRFATVVRNAPPERRRALVQDLRETIDNLGLLLEEIGDDDDT